MKNDLNQQSKLNMQQANNLTNHLLPFSALVLSTFLLSACGSVEKVKERFGGTDEKATLEDTSAVATPAVPLNPRQQLLVDIQQALDGLGYAPGRTDGRIDAQTEAAIQDFQLDNDMRITGRPSPELLQKLKRATRSR